MPGRSRRPVPTTHAEASRSDAPPTKVAPTEMWSRRKPPRAAPSMMESWMAATMSPPPLSGSSAMPLVSQVDHATGMAELMAPQATIATPTAQIECWPASRPSVTAARATGRPPSRRYRCRPANMLAPDVPTNPAIPSPSSRSDSCGVVTPVRVSRNGLQIGERGEGPGEGEHHADHRDRDVRRLRSPNSLPTGLAAWGGIAGRLTHCQAMFAAVSGTRAQKTPRQPMTPPR